MSSASFLLQFIRSPTQSWKHLENPQILVESLAATIVALQFLQFILHRVRVWAKHWSVRRGSWASYYLPVPLAASAVAVMLRFPCPYWLVAIFFAAAQADAMAAYSLRDEDKRSVRRFGKRALYFAYLIVLLRGDGDGMLACRRLRRAEVLSLVLGFVIILQDLKISSRDMIPSSEICMVATDHVRFQERRRPTFSDDDPPAQPSVVTVGSLESYRSAVSGCVTLEDICIYIRSCSARLKDACLSSALFLQLLQRHDTAHRHIHQALQPSSASHAFKDQIREYGMERAFKLVEVQLSFMYDYFFSTHGSPSRTSYRLYVTYSILKIGFLLSVRSLMLEEKQGRVISATLYALILLELCQLVVYLKSNGFLVSYFCDRNKDLDDIFGDLDSTIIIEVLSFFLDLLGWTREVQLGQYSLIEDFDRSPGLKQLLKARLMGRRQPHHQRGTINPRKKKIGPPSTSDRSWHLYHLKSWIGGKAVSSEPKRFAFDGSSHMWVSESLDWLSWSLRQETTIHTILIWHIATWFCAMAAAEDTMFLLVERLLPSGYTFATMLSNYCAYLVAFRPELLPEHRALTASIFGEAVRQAELNFGSEDNTSSSSDDERYTKMKSFYRQTSRCSDEVFLKPGVELGEQLMRYRGPERWKVMAEFWAEMTLFVARSGNAHAHIEHLAGGGELVTELWAFLSNGWDRTFIRRNNNDDDMNWWVAPARSMLEWFVECLQEVDED